MRAIILLLSLLSAAPDQIDVPLDADVEELSPAAPETRIVVLDHDLEDAWLEITHLGTADLPPVVVALDRRLSPDEPFAFVPDLPPGPTMVCSSARTRGVDCEVVYRGGDEFVSLEDVVVEFPTGLEVRGSYRQDLDPVAGARVAVVPADLAAFRPFTMPLGVVDGHVARAVPTDDDGRFELPELAPGDYFLETVLPSGRVHRTELFTVPDRDALRRQYEVDERLYEPGDLFWDLGVIDVPSGLDVELRVLDATGDPIPGAAVSATQGRTPFEVLNFEGTSGADGRVALHGLDVELPVRLACEKRGYRPFEEDYELLPVAVDCVLQRWARVAGEVIGPDSQAPRGATVTVSGATETPASATVAGDGSFVVGELPAGDYELRAAAPGFRVEERTFTVDFGERYELGPILLLFARQIDGRVVDSLTGEPVAGVDIRSLSPPGAVDSFSDVDGEFSFGVDSTEPLAIEFSTFDYAARQITLDEEAFEGGEPLVVELVPAGWILAEVEDDEGGRCQGCRLVIWPGGEELWTDGLGEALSGPLAPGVHRVSRPRVTHLGSTVVEQPEADLHRVRVKPGRLSVVRLASSGRTVRVRFEGDLEGIWTMSARSPRRSEKTYPDDDGRFPVRQKSGETLDLFLHTWDEAAGREIAVWQSTLPAGLAADQVTVRLSGSSVRGRVTGLDGPTAGAEVRLLAFADAALRAVTYTYADGSFVVPHMRPGVYNLYVGPRAVKFLSVGERQTVDLGTFELFLDGEESYSR